MATYRIKPRSSNDDVRYRDGAGFQSASETFGRIGYYDGSPAGKTQMVLYLHTVPAGETITSAYLKLFVKDKPSGSGKSFVSNVENAALSITVTWTCNVSGMTVGGTITTPDIKSIVQDIVDTEGYDPEVGAGFWVGWGDAAKGEYFDIEVYDGAEGEDAWEIEVTTEDDPSTATCASTCTATTTAVEGSVAWYIEGTAASTTGGATTLAVGRSYTTGAAEIASSTGVPVARVRGIVTSPTIDTTIASTAAAATSAIAGLVDIVGRVASTVAAATSAVSAERTGPTIDTTIDASTAAATSTARGVQDVVVRIASTVAAAETEIVAERTGPTIDATIDSECAAAETAIRSLIPSIGYIASTTAAATSAVSAERTGPTDTATIASTAPVTTAAVLGDVTYPPINAHDVDSTSPAATSSVSGTVYVHHEVPGTAWRLEVHSEHGSTVAWLPLVQNCNFTLRLNEPGSLSFDYAQDRAEAEHLERPYQVYLYDNWSRLVDRFRILRWSDVRTGNNILRHVECESLLGLLMDEYVAEYTATDKTVAEIVEELLALQVNTTPIRFGKIDAAIGDLVRTVTIRDMSLLQAVNEVYDLVQDGYFWVRPDTRALEWREKTERSRGQTIHYRKQMKGIARTYDTSKLVNRLYAYGNGTDSETRIKLTDAGEAQEYIEDAGSQSDYGIVTRSLTWPTVEDPDTLLELAELYLDTYATPYLGYKVDAAWLPALGGSFDYDRLQVGAPVYVVDDSLGIAVSTHVVEMSGSLSDEFNIQVILSNKGQNFFQWLASLEKRLRALETAEHPVPVVVADVTVAGALPPTLREGEFVYDKATGLPGFIGADGLWYPMTGDSENETFVTNIENIVNNSENITVGAELTDGPPEALAEIAVIGDDTAASPGNHQHAFPGCMARQFVVGALTEITSLLGTAGYPQALRAGDTAAVVIEGDDTYFYNYDGAAWYCTSHYEEPA